MNIEEFVKESEGYDDVLAKNEYALSRAIDAAEIIASKISEKDFQRVVNTATFLAVANIGMEDIDSLAHFLLLQENKKLLAFTLSVAAATIGVLIDNEVL